MNRLLITLAIAATAACHAAPMQDANPTAPADSADAHLWLEDVLAERSLTWVRARNEESQQAIASDDSFADIQARVLAILDSTDRIPYVAKRGEHYYNLWQDADNPRGLWRRTSLDEYRKSEPEWETVLDLDALGQAEGENWVWKGSSWMSSDRTRCLLSLSRGGADAVVVREFDVIAKSFVEGGFELPEAKTRASWRDRDSLYVGTDFGPGSMTESGYPRLVKIWKRGTPLASAETVAEGELDDVSISGYRDHTPGFERDFVARALTFFTNEMSVRVNGAFVRLDKPDSAMARVHQNWLMIELRDDWEVGGTQHVAGSLLVMDLDAFLAGERAFDVLFTPSERRSLSSFSGTKNHLLINVLDNVRNKVQVATHANGAWSIQPLEGLPEFGTISASAVDSEEGDAYWLTITDFVTPTSLWMGTLDAAAPTPIKSLPALYDASGIAVEQLEATSADGTRIPYFLIAKDSLQRDGTNPTLLYGYGGFEISLTPRYSATVGASWIERGGVYVIANIRGGGEFGPRWHQAALKANRNRCYEDFAAVARDLVARSVTAPEHLGIQGGSNGGLLVGNMLTSYPDLMAAVVCQVPLLDMLRYHKLLAGASWMGEYGDPDKPEEAAWLRRYSPYHNLDADTNYPKVLFTTSTRDDRVHPGHARKMMARMREQGHDALYYENIEGGHGGAADNKQAAYMTALAYTFLWQTLR